MITIVTGFQRCGSSLMMQMLAAGGMPTFSDEEMGYPAFETHRQHAAPDPVWFASCDGKALKWLEPQHTMPPPVDCELRVLWMKRDYDQQAKSAVKFMRLVGGVHLPGAARRQMAASYRTNEKAALRLWLQRAARVLVVDFEDVLANPYKSAMAVSLFLNVPLDTQAMGKQVRVRPPECLDGLLELALIEEGR